MTDEPHSGARSGVTEADEPGHGAATAGPATTTAGPATATAGPATAAAALPTPKAAAAMPAAGRWLPGRALPALALGTAPVALLGGAGAAAVLAIDAALVVLSFVEARALGKSGVTAERRLDGRLVMGIRTAVLVELHNPSSRSLRVTVRDDLPAGWDAGPGEHVVTLPPFARREVRYEVTPQGRGDFVLGALDVKVEGGLHLGASIVATVPASSVRVYPNVLGDRRDELRSRAVDPRRGGLRNVRQSGGGGEFAQLREYVRGDAYRDLDWKATAKRQRPVTKVREHERSQTVILAIDAGRTMASRLPTDRERVPMTKLDHAIGAALLLAHVALRAGDRVGLCVFDGDVRTFVPPRRGQAHYRAMLDAIYATEATLSFVDFRRMAEVIKARVPRRALLVVLTDLLDEAHAMPLAEHAKVLRKKHLTVCVTLREPEADALAQAKVVAEPDLYLRAAAADVLLERDVVRAHLRASGVSLVEAPAGELGVEVVKRYLEIKERRAL